MQRLKWLRLRSNGLTTTALLLGSVAAGIFYFESQFHQLNERLSEDGSGYFLEQLREPNQLEREQGEKVYKPILN